MAEKKHKWLKRAGYALLILAILVATLSVWFHLATRIDPPEVDNRESLNLKVENPAPDFYRAGNNWLKKSRSGLWELYLEGKPFERGVIEGKLSRHLIASQEKAFIDQIRVMIPSPFYLRFLKYVIYWFNRDLDRYLTDEYKQEIYGISLSASDQYSFIGSGYHRILNYHSAHDIGHALQDFNLVGCTSFGVWGKKSKDGSLVIGRNFDFYMGDEFAENKIICFEKPEKGHPFMMITWGGMIGTVSGMNDAGLTVTINAARSKIPASARTPISMVTREILQYASDISEAISIAGKRQTFVSESILVGSARDRQAVIIEKSPYHMAVVKPSGDYIACANHFQSAEFSTDRLNMQNKKENASVYRFDRLLQDITEKAPIGYPDAAAILRDRSGMNGTDIGMGNEKAMNQLIAHHSVIFMPEKRLVWVSTSPWQLGSYVCYDLYKIFHNFAGLQQNVEVTETGKAIAPDPFLGTGEYRKFTRFREMRAKLEHLFRSGDPFTLPDSFFQEFRDSNPMYYEVYALAGDYYAGRQQWVQARPQYLAALTRVIPRWREKESIIKKLVNCNIKLQTKNR